ncbi:hypothetical protein BC567DRAFT_67016 [Phyllosticta citribraziliensis]
MFVRCEARGFRRLLVTLGMKTGNEMKEEKRKGQNRQAVHWRDHVGSASQGNKVKCFARGATVVGGSIASYRRQSELPKQRTDEDRLPCSASALQCRCKSPLEVCISQHLQPSTSRSCPLCSASLAPLLTDSIRQPRPPSPHFPVPRAVKSLG